MNRVKNWFRRGALATATMLTVATVAQGQVAGKVTDFGGATLSGATVEIWDTYPGGSILTTAVTDADGEFSVPDIGSGTFDMRIRNANYYPSVIRDLPHPISNVKGALTLVPPPVEKVTPSSASFWSSTSVFLGTLIKQGDIVTATDPDGVPCSKLGVGPTNGDFLLYVLGDDPTTGTIDEGAQDGDLIDFFINGLPANPKATWYNRGDSQIGLAAVPEVPGVTVVGPPDMGGTPGEVTVVTYEVTNTGTVAGTFTLSAAVDVGWAVSLPTSVGPLDPDESMLVDVLVTVPTNPGTDPATLSFWAVSDSYQAAYSGSFTQLDVNTTGIGDNGGNGSLVPDGFSLAQNYPNPFNPRTQIAFNLSTAGYVRLEVFNLLGQSVAVLLDEYRPVGPGTVEWDGRDRFGGSVPSGVYFYRLVQDGRSQTRKMVLLK